MHTLCHPTLLVQECSTHRSKFCWLKQAPGIHLMTSWFSGEILKRARPDLNVGYHIPVKQEPEIGSNCKLGCSTFLDTESMLWSGINLIISHIYPYPDKMVGYKIQFLSGSSWWTMMASTNAAASRLASAWCRRRSCLKTCPQWLGSCRCAMRPGVSVGLLQEEGQVGIPVE